MVVLSPITQLLRHVPIPSRGDGRIHMGFAMPHLIYLEDDKKELDILTLSRGNEEASLVSYLDTI